MPYVSVHIDIDDVLGEASEQELRDELASRSRKKGDWSGNADDYSIPPTVAKYTLQEAADIFRREGRHSLAFKLDEIRCDFVEH